MIINNEHKLIGTHKPSIQFHANYYNTLFQRNALD